MNRVTTLPLSVCIAAFIFNYSRGDTFPPRLNFYGLLFICLIYILLFDSMIYLLSHVVTVSEYFLRTQRIVSGYLAHNVNS